MGKRACVLSCFGHVWLHAALWTAARQAPQSMGFSRQEYWSGLPCPPPGGLPDPGISPASHVSCMAGWLFTTSATWEAAWVSCAVLSRFSHVRLFVSIWTMDCQVPLSLGFCRQEYWSGLLCPLPGGLPHPGIKPASPMPLALVGEFFTASTTLKRDTPGCLQPGHTWFPELSSAL